MRVIKALVNLDAVADHRRDFCKLFIINHLCYNTTANIRSHYMIGVRAMDINEFQQWVKQYYDERNWSGLDIFIRIGFLAEETGEVARAIRALEIGRDRPDEAAGTYEENKENLTEELGDVLGNLIVIANKYDISLTEVFEAHQRKLAGRYS
ncbi:NTP pyrophosphatase (non-canonical NTP hydrolase) [Fontibacillus solani]|uniref:NTP pyrophosphatase (Non-canonical NTP hydrolase) n=2 Tax=Fontibacillus solani TaxID=1572857 RepID=A0A7W3XU65_9BACL|nr:NTP pyrophosphatase (non-canonical NTP hydrolase) [Fontibacillus solani]